MRSRRYKTGFWIALALLACVAVFSLTPVKTLFSEQFLVDELHRSGRYAALVFIGGFTLATSLGFPGNVLTIAGGAVFGVFWGFLWSLIGTTAGAVGAFLLARTLLHDWVERHFGHHAILKRLNQSITNNPFSFVLAIRFTPISPFSLVNFLFGLTPVDLKTYTISTFLGMIPTTIAYAWIGASGKQVLNGGDRIPFFLALGFLALLSLLPILGKRKFGR